MTEQLVGADIGYADAGDTQPIPEVAPPPFGHGMIVEDLQNVIFKLRAFTESADGDLGLGVELGMQRAADMIENLINRYIDRENERG